MKKSVLFALLFAAFFPLLAQQNLITERILQYPAASFEELTLIKDVKPIDVEFRKDNPALQAGLTFKLAPTNVEELLQRRTSYVRLQLPFPDGQTRSLLLIPGESQSPVFMAYDQSRTRHPQLEVDAHYYWGFIEGESQSSVAISVFRDQIIGLILSQTGTYNIAKIDGDPAKRHLLYREQDLDVALDFECGVAPQEALDIDREAVINRVTSNPANCVLMYVEVDYDITEDKGGVANTTDYITGLFNQISLMYFNEAINLNLHELIVWDQEDPYTGPSTGNYLSQFRDETGLGFNGDLAHLVGYQGGGGVAYLNVLCNTSFAKHGYSGINANYNEVPVFSWSVEVVTHEVGHNLGSPHTHDCVWNGNDTAIDRCGIEAGYGTSGPCNINAGIPDDGTVMSYCHLVGAGIDLALGFGPQPGDLIRDKVYNAECLTPCAPEPEICFDNFDNDFDGLTDCEDPDCAEYVDCLPCEDNIINFVLTFDDFSSQTSWVLLDDGGAPVGSGGPYSNSFYANTTITEEFCMDESCYTLTIFDAFGDGICCNAGEGSFQLTDADGMVLTIGGTFADETSVEICNGIVQEHCFDGIDNDLDGLIDCADPDCDEEDYCIACSENVVSLIITFDDHPEETSWEVLGFDGTVLYTDAGDETIADGATVLYNYCLLDGCYYFRIIDSGNDGICCFQGLGSYVLQNSAGAVYATGGEFGDEEITTFCTQESLCPVGTTFTVTTVQDSINGSLRQAINCSNALASLDTIVFDLPADDTLFINGSLPTIIDEHIYIDGGEERVIVYNAIQPLFTIAGRFCTLRGLKLFSGQPGFATAIIAEAGSESFRIRDNHIEDFRQLIDVQTKNGLIRNNTLNGFNFQRLVTLLASSGQVTIDSNRFDSPGNATGIYSLASNIQVRDNEFSNLRNGIQVARADSLVIDGNVMHDNWWGVNIDGNFGDGQANLITQNSMYCNLYNGGIQLLNGANNGKFPPELTEVTNTTVMGTALPGDLIEVYLSDNSTCDDDAPCQGKTYLNTTYADADGAWLLNGLSLSGGEFLTALATDSENNSSSFADCLEFVPECPEFTLRLVASPTVVCPDGGVQLYLATDETWFGNLNWDYQANGETQTVTDFQLSDTLVVYPEVDTEFRLISAVSTFGCELITENTQVQVQVLDEQDLMSFQSVELCAGQTILINGEEVGETGTYTEMLTSISGCDSLIEIELTVFDTQETFAELSLCEGDEVEIFGNTVNEAGVYEATFLNQNGCDSTHNITVSLFPHVQTEAALQLCDGQTIELFGETVNTSGTYSGSSMTAEGCDSTHTVFLTVTESILTSESLPLCEGSSIELFGELVTEAGTYEGMFQSEAGCDSIHEVTVTLIDAVSTSADLQICEGESIEVFGEMVSEAGTYSETFESAVGCDSTHTIMLTVDEPAFTDQTIQACPGQTVTVFGEDYTEDAIVMENFTTVNGCDSTHTVELVFADLIETSEAASICAGETIIIFDEEVSEAGIYTESFVTAAGCDSIHEVSLSVLQPTEAEEFVSICEGESVLIFGDPTSTSGTYEATFTADNGCDSMHTIVLSVNDNIFTSEALPLCAGSSIELFGELVTEAGTYQGMFQSVAGCDSIHEVTVSLTEVINTTADAQICDGESIEVFGEMVSEAGTYSATFESSADCDSTHTITLFVGEPAFTDQAIQACPGQTVTVFGEDYTEDVVLTEIFTTVNGCDSTHTVELTFTDLIETSEALSICDGETILIFGTEVSDSGVYTESFVTAEGCDSIHQVNLSVLEPTQEEEFLRICEGETVLIFDDPVGTAGTYEATFTASNGCDSTQVYHLEVLEPSTSQELMQICDGESVFIFGENQTETGVYTASFTAANGCDSTAVIELSFYDSPTVEASITHACAGESAGSISLAHDQLNPDFIWEHTAENTPALTELPPANYTVTVVDDNNCESEWEFTVDELPSPEYDLEIQPLSCGNITDGVIEVVTDDPNLEISFAGGPYTSTMLYDALGEGVYVLRLRTEAGCEVTEEVALEASESIELAAMEVEQPTCEGQEDGSIGLEVAGGNANLTFSWSSGQNGPQITGLDVGTYIVTITNVNGCTLESTFELPGLPPIDPNLQLLLGCGDGQVIATTTPDSGEPPYEINWSDDQTGTVAAGLSAGMYQLTLTDANGCSVTEDFEVPFITPFEVDYSVVNPSCSDAEDGSISLQISGGIPPYDISWDNGATGVVLDNLSGGEYAYNVTSGSCGSWASVQVLAPATLGAEVEFSMNGQQNLQALALVSGGTPPYSYQWSNGSTTNTAVGLQAGQMISLTVTDGNGCLFSQNYTAVLTHTLSPEAVSLRVFPNPTSSQLFVQHSNAEGWKYQLSLYSIDGVQLISPMEVQRQNFELTTADFAPGTYLLILANANFRRVERIVIIP